jgi:hypothetical protein
MRGEYKDWLHRQGYGDGTIVAQLHRVGRVEEHYGDLDAHFERDGLASVLEALTYSTEDERRGRPNPTKIPFVGNIRNNLASYKSAVLWYRRFRESKGLADHSVSGAAVKRDAASPAIGESQPETWSQIATRAPARQPLEPRLGRRTLVDFNLDGRAALEAIISSSQYRTIAQAVASLTLFSHPKTVRQTGGRALFPAIRNPRRVGQIDVHQGRQVLLDDNKSATDAFLWANGLSRRGRDTQFNHVYATSLDVEAYTALPNICMTPAFIAKLTDTSEDVRSLLRYRSYQLYKWTPAGHPPPEPPDDYEALEWCAPLPPVEDVRSTIIAAMATKPKDRTVVAVGTLGWLFANGAPTAGVAE